jgi:hypothetical protein
LGRKMMNGMTVWQIMMHSERVHDEFYNLGEYKKTLPRPDQK